MLRFGLEYLKICKSKPSRKPLVLRGARQVGKTYLVRLFAKKYFDEMVEINFERDSCFSYTAIQPYCVTLPGQELACNFSLTRCQIMDIKL